MGMTDVSKEYLDRLIKASGIKMNSAKHQAMIAIIDQLDENSLGGLLESIREDYKHAVQMIKQLDSLKINVAGCNNELSILRSEINQLKFKRDKLADEVRTLQDKIIALEKEGNMLEMLPDERSRVLAYETAIGIGMKQIGKMLPSDDMIKQVIRSASNVAGRTGSIGARMNGGNSDEQ